MIKSFKKLILKLLKILNINIYTSDIYIYLKNKFLIKDKETTLIYIHIGKCGGTTLLKSLKASSKTKKYLQKITIHLHKPPIMKKAKYAIVIRNPIKRAISAYNWRYNHVIKNNGKTNILRGEYKVLSKYKNINELAENLFINNKANKKAHKDFRKIRHLREDISFYLKDLLPKISKKQIFAVFSTEGLNHDIYKILKVKNNSYENMNHHKTTPNNKKLSKFGYKNLKKFLVEDYNCIEKILDKFDTNKKILDDFLENQ